MESILCVKLALNIGGPVKLRRVRLKADILVYYDPEAKTEAKTELFQDLRYALKSQLRNMEDKVRRNWDVRNLCASHFKPMHLGHHISIVKWVRFIPSIIYSSISLFFKFTFSCLFLNLRRLLGP